MQSVDQLEPNSMKAVLIGAGAQGRVALDLLKSMEEFSEVEFLDDDESRWGTVLNGAKIGGPVDSLASYDKNIFKAFITLGDPLARRRLAKRLEELAVPLANLIHRSAYLAPSCTIGLGNTLCAKAVVNSNALVENHVLVNNASVIEHDTRLANFVTVCPGAQVGGRVELDEGSFIATGAIVLPRLKVGKYSVLAAGSLLTKDLPDHVLAMGSPARIVKEIGEDFDWRRLL